MATELRLRDGSAAMTWALLPTDREGLRAEYEHLSPESQRHRFLTPMPHLTDALLDSLVDDVDGVDHVALVLFVIDEDHVGQPAGVGRMIRYPDDPAAADVAVTVADAYQGRGVASALLAELLRQRPAGVERLETEVAADNPASLAMLRRLGPSTVTRDGGNLLRVTVELPPPEAEGPGPDAQAHDPAHDPAHGEGRRRADGTPQGSSRS